MPVAFHPGGTIKDEIEARGISANRLALDLGIPANRVTAIINAKRAVSADTAMRLGAYFGNGARFWLTLQTNYDLAVAERDHGKEIARTVRKPEAA